MCSFKSVWGGRQFSRLLAAEVCASVIVMLDTPCSEVVWRVLATHCIWQFPLHFPSRESLCVITFQLETISRVRGWNVAHSTAKSSFCIGLSETKLYLVIAVAHKSYGIRYHIIWKVHENTKLFISIHVPCIFYCFVQWPTKAQLVDKLSQSPHIFRRYCVILRVFVVRTLLSYTSNSNAANNFI